MPVVACNDHKNDYVESKVQGKDWNPSLCCQNHLKFLRREPGLFKKEFEGNRLVALACKSYYCSGDGENKQVSKGVSIHQNRLTFDQYLEVLRNDQPLFITNRGFQTRNHKVFTYNQRKRGLTSFYCKRKVLDDGIETVPLDL